MTRAKKIRIAVLVVLAIVLASLFLSDGGGPTIEPGSTLIIELEGDYTETVSSSLTARLLGEKVRPFLDLLLTFAKAERDDRIKNIVLVIRPLQIGWAKAEEIREAISRLEKAGRHTVAYLDMGIFNANLEYYVASAANQVELVPGGAVPVTGLAAEYFFLGGVAEKLGIGFEVGKAGRYKSAVETLTAESMSEASREMANSLLDSTYEIFVDGIARGRSLSHDKVLQIIDRGPMLPQELEALDLVDRTRYLEELLTELGDLTVHQDAYEQVDPADLGFDPVARVAILYGTGMVVEGKGRRSRSGQPVFASRATSTAIADAVADPQVDAIILRIDSPGGSALAAEKIWRSIDHARKAGKPIIASFSDMAASGGYYVAVAADEIVSNPATLTGSIGVFAIRPNLKEALAKIDLKAESLLRGRYAGFSLTAEPLSAAGLARLQAFVLETYRVFVERVSKGRAMEVEAVDRVAQGRVWTGEQAYQVGLVDHLGGLHTAVSVVRRRLDLPADADIALIPFPAARSFSEELSDLLNFRIHQSLFEAGPLQALGFVQHWFIEIGLDTPLLIPPFMVEIK